jgi:hypothetical protein
MLAIIFGENSFKFNQSFNKQTQIYFMNQKNEKRHSLRLAF